MLWTPEDKERWVDTIGVPEEDYEYLETFVKELKLSGGKGYLSKAPWNLDVPWRRGVYQRIAEFFSESNLVYLEYNWLAKSRRWCVRPPSSGRSSYKTVENAIEYISRLLKSYEECGI